MDDRRPAGKAGSGGLDSASGPGDCNYSRSLDRDDRLGWHTATALLSQFHALPAVCSELRTFMSKMLSLSVQYMTYASTLDEGVGSQQSSPFPQILVGDAPSRAAIRERQTPHFHSTWFNCMSTSSPRPNRQITSEAKYQ